MQTKKQIQTLLESAGISPKKSLGQHYLIDLNLIRLLLSEAEVRSSDTVLEVGCGTGALTEEIAEKAGRCVAVELDRAMANIAESRLAKFGNTDILKTDILVSKHSLNTEVTKLLAQYRKEYKGRLLLVSNLPYNIATALMINLIKHPFRIDAMYVTIQKEVAQRMTSKPGSGHYGPLSILLNATGEMNLIRTLNPAVFWPRPRVESAIASYRRSQEKVDKIENINVLSDIVHFFMSHRRKMLKSCVKLPDSHKLKINNWPDIFKKASIDPTLRPEQLSPQNYVLLANMCHRMINTGEKK